MTNCQKCSSDRFLDVNVSVKFDQEMTVTTQNKCLSGQDVSLYDIPNILFSGTVSFTVCLDCGQMQGQWPVEKLYVELE